MGLAAKKSDSAADLIARLQFMPLTPAELRALIECTWMHIETDKERRVVAMKASRDGAGLPPEMLRRDLEKPGIGYVCRCVAAMTWPNNE